MTIPNLPARASNRPPSDLDLNPQAILADTYCTIDLTDPANAEVADRVYYGDGAKGDDLIGQEISIQHVLLYRRIRMDEETGEQTDGVAEVLWVDGEGPVRFESRGILRELKRLSLRFGQPPWSPPIRVILRQKTLPGARRTYRFDIVGRST